MVRGELRADKIKFAHKIITSLMYNYEACRNYQ